MAWLRRAVFLAVLLGLHTAHAGSVVNVQVIDVCATDGTNCALSTGVASAYDPAAIQKVFAQAGVTVNLLAPVNYDNSAFLNPGVIDDPGHGYTTGSPTDPAHLLFNTPGHMQNANPNVVDLYFVDSLPHTTVLNGASTPANLLYGVALQNGNGGIAVTHLQTDSTGTYYPTIDNVAHEIGHMLGLTHTDDPPLAGTAADTPNNLMRSLNRDFPTDPCQVTPTTCGGTPKDILTSTQIAQVQASAQNLFSVGLATATASFDQSGGACQPNAVTCQITVAFPTAATGEVLDTVKVRYLGASPDKLVNLGELIYYFDPCTRSLRSPIGTNTALAGGGTEQSFNFPGGCFTAGNAFIIYEADGLDGNHEDLTPFSFEFDFSDGKTSRAAFDSTGNGVFTATSTLPVELGNTMLPQQPGIPIPTDPAEFNRQSVPEDESTPVPEAPSLAVMAAAFAALCVARGGRCVQTDTSSFRPRRERRCGE